MRWFVVADAGPQAKRPSGDTHAQPPGPGFPLHAPSLKTTARSGRGGEGDTG